PRRRAHLMTTPDRLIEKVWLQLVAIEPLLFEIPVTADLGAKQLEPVGGVGDPPQRHGGEHQRVADRHHGAAERLILPLTSGQIARALDELTTSVDDRFREPHEFRGIVLVVAGEDAGEHDPILLRALDAAADRGADAAVAIVPDDGG